jgi:integrase
MAETFAIPRPSEYASALGPWIRSFIQEKQDGGFRYPHASTFLKWLDRQLADEGGGAELGRESAERFVAHRPGERPRSQLARYSVTRQFALYLNRQGVSAWVPVERMVIVRQGDFVPYIFTRDQMASIFDAADRHPMLVGYPYMPLILRLFYGCGLRKSEVMGLDVQDFEAHDETLRIADTKFGKSRRVPIAPSLAERMRAHIRTLRTKRPDAPLFPAKTRRASRRHGSNQIYLAFRRILAAAGIGHGGRGKGPRLHDLRHTFAVHRMESWYRQGCDVNALLPLLVAYMGHGHLSRTQYYLRLTPVLFPDLAKRMEEYAGRAFPAGGAHETN